MIIAPHAATGQRDYRLVVNISLDGGKTWVDGTRRGTTVMNNSHDFVLVPDPPGFSFTTPTVQLSRNHFLTVYCSGNPLAVNGSFWHIEEKRTAKDIKSLESDKRLVETGSQLHPPLSISSARQLFINDHIIESLDGVVKKLNQPAKHLDNPVLPMVPKTQKSWNAGMPVSFSSVLFEENEQLFRMWYSLHTRGQGDEESVLCYATSTDGIAWQKPVLGICQFRGTNQNNIVMNHSGLASGVFRDQCESDPGKRYKMLHMWHDYKVYASYSAEGLR